MEARQVFCFWLFLFHIPHTPGSFHHHGSELGICPNTKYSIVRFVSTARLSSTSIPRRNTQGNKATVPGLSRMLSQNPRDFKGSGSFFFMYLASGWRPSVSVWTTYGQCRAVLASCLGTAMLVEGCCRNDEATSRQKSSKRAVRTRVCLFGILVPYHTGSYFVVLWWYRYDQVHGKHRRLVAAGVVAPRRSSLVRGRSHINLVPTTTTTRGQGQPTLFNWTGKGLLWRDRIILI